MVRKIARRAGIGVRQQDAQLFDYSNRLGPMHTDAERHDVGQP